MAHLPPVAWNEVVARADVSASDAALRNEFRVELSQALECQMRWMVTLNTALVAVALAATRLLF